MSRRNRRLTKPEGARPTLSPAARYAAPSRVWGDLSPSRQPPAAAASGLQRSQRRQVSLSAVRHRRNFAPQGDFFGAWSLYPPSPLVQKLQRAVTCVRRGIRREVLFASRATGAGSVARKKHYSNRSCK